VQDPKKKKLEKQQSTSSMSGQEFVAIADYLPEVGSPGDCIRLTEGQVVEVEDCGRADQWLVKTRPTALMPVLQGWVPSAYLEEKARATALQRRDDRERFREDVLKVKNKQQEAVLKRRYLLKEIQDTEREYVKDLKQVEENFKKAAKGDDKKALDAVLDKLGFAKISEFHESFLQELEDCSTQPLKIGSVFLKHKAEFDNYIGYLQNVESALQQLQSPELKNFLKDQSKARSEPSDQLAKLLSKPVERLAMYQLLLKDFLRYTVRAGEEVKPLEDAVAMLIGVELAASKGASLPVLAGFGVDMEQFGTVVRHGELIEMAGSVSSVTSETERHERHAMLTSQQMVLSSSTEMVEEFSSSSSSVQMSSSRVQMSSHEVSSSSQSLSFSSAIDDFDF